MRRTLIPLLVVPVFVWADSSQNIQDLITQHESELVRIQQEAQTVHQQFQMIQELRRYEMNETSVSIQPSETVESIPVPNYDDILKRKKEKQARIQQYGIDLDTLYLRHKELNERRDALFNEIEHLKRVPEE